jgi:outer membrane protein TolC
MKLPLFSLHLVVLLMLAGLPAIARDQPKPLTLDDAVTLAITTDPWLSGSQHREDALFSESVAAKALPDPRVSLMLANIPTDSFEVGQEAMTQLTLGVSQAFPRGNTRALSGRQKLEQAAQEPLLREDRKARLAATVRQLWLDAFQAEESIRLIELDRSLFEYLVDATRASYSSAVGRARQHDIIRAQLELTRLEDRLTVLRQQLESSRRVLSEWIGGHALLPLADTWPRLEVSTRLAGQLESEQELFDEISQHPGLLAFDLRIAAMQTSVELARQQYAPQWGLSAQYGHRRDDLMGRERADLLSVGVTFDLPVFTGNRQDKNVSAAVSRVAALRTDKTIMVRKMLAELKTALSRVERLNERKALYAQQLLPQMAEQAEAALAAYNNDDGDFAEAVRARIAELNGKIEALVIEVQCQQTLSSIHYLLTRSSTGAGHAQNRSMEAQ